MNPPKTYIFCQVQHKLWLQFHVELFNIESDVNTIISLHRSEHNVHTTLPSTHEERDGKGA